MTTEVAVNVDKIIDKLSEKLGIAIHELEPITKEVIRQYQMKNLFIAIFSIFVMIVLIVLAFKWIRTKKEEFVKDVIEKFKKHDYQIFERYDHYKEEYEEWSEKMKNKCDYEKIRNPYSTGPIEPYSNSLSIDSDILVAAKIGFSFVIIIFLTMLAVTATNSFANYISPLASMLGY